MNINTRPGSQEIPLLNSVLVACVIVLLCAAGALAYTLIWRNSAHLKRQVSFAFEMSQLKADTRTLFAGARWLLEPEPADPAPDAAANSKLTALPSRSEPRAQTCLNIACASGASNCCRLSPTNAPHPG